MNDIERVAHLAVISDADASRLVSDRTRADLAARIMATHAAQALAPPA